MFANKSHAQAFELYLKKDLEEALELFNEALRETPSHPDLHSDRAFCYLHLGKKNECMTDLNEAIQLQSAYAYRYSCLGFVNQLSGNIDAARKNYEKALQLDPKESIALHNLQIIEKPSVTPLKNPEEIRIKIL